MDLEGFLSARRIAVVGASPGHYFSDRLRENLDAGARGIKVHPVHPGHRRVWGLKAYPSLAALPSRPDLVMLLVPAAEALDALGSMRDLGIARAVVLASGFDARRTKRLASLGGSVEIIGPESLGLMDVTRSRLLFCGRLASKPPRGRVSIVSRSGGLLVECLRTLDGDPRWGVSRVVCCGREASLGAAEVLEALAADVETDAVVVLLERDPAVASLSGPLISLASGGKEIILFSTAEAHPGEPGALATGKADDVVAASAVQALARRVGGLLARDMDEVSEAAAFVSSRPGGRGRGGSVLLVSVSAGVGEWMGRDARAAGLEMASVGRGLRAKLPAEVPASNPIDLSAAGVTDPALLERTVRACVSQKSVGGVLVAMHPPSGSSGSDRRNARWLAFLDGLRTHGPLVMAVQPTVGVAGPAAGLTRGLAGASRIARWWLGARAGHAGEHAAGDVDRDEALRILHGPARALSEPSSRRLLETYGIEFDPWHLAETPSQAARRARGLPGQACLKLASPDVPAASRGCTRGPVSGDAAAREAFMDITVAGRDARADARILGVIVTLHRQAGGALFVTTVSPGEAGPPLVACGPGGPGRDLIRAYVPALCPLAPAEAREVAAEALRLANRTDEPSALASLLERISRFASDFAREVAVVDLATVVEARGRWLPTEARVTIRRRVELR